MDDKTVKADLMVVQLDRARTALAEAKTIGETKKVMDMAHAAQIYARRQQLGEEAMAYALAIKIEALRKLGEMLASTPKAKPGTKPQFSSTLEPNSPTLAELQINRKVAMVAQQLAAMPDEQFEQVREGTKTMAQAIQFMRREEVAADLNDIGNRKAKALAGLYDVIVMDPPWPMEKIEREVAPNQVKFDYPTMDEEQLTKLNVPCADSCHVWVWTTHKHLPMALRLLDEWRLKYVCTFVWHKPGGFQPFGLPQYNCEFALYARRGTPSFLDLKDLMVCFDAPRGAHSEKPQAFYDVVRRVTGGRRLDMFNRRAIDGFESWGNEAND